MVGDERDPAREEDERPGRPGRGPGPLHEPGVGGPDPVPRREEAGL